MTALTLAKLVHLASLLVLLYASWQKNRLLLPRQIDLVQLRKLRFFDKLSAATAGLMLLSGGAMMFIVGKPTAYYASHPGMIVKITIFIVASAFVVRTKIEFRRAVTNIQPTWTVPNAIRAIIRTDFAGLICMALLGHWVARGM